VQTINKMPSIKAQIKPLLHQIKVAAFMRREARQEERSSWLASELQVKEKIKKERDNSILSQQFG
jgi:hypothetical protein